MGVSPSKYETIPVATTWRNTKQRGRRKDILGGRGQKGDGRGDKGKINFADGVGRTF